MAGLLSFISLFLSFIWRITITTFGVLPNYNLQWLLTSLCKVANMFQYV